MRRHMLSTHGKLVEKLDLKYNKFRVNIHNDTRYTRMWSRINDENDN